MIIITRKNLIGIALLITQAPLHMSQTYTFKPPEESLRMLLLRSRAKVAILKYETEECKALPTIRRTNSSSHISLEENSQEKQLSVDSKKNINWKKFHREAASREMEKIRFLFDRLRR